MSASAPPHAGGRSLRDALKWVLDAEHAAQRRYFGHATIIAAISIVMCFQPTARDLIRWERAVSGNGPPSHEQSWVKTVWYRSLSRLDPSRTRENR